MYEPHVLSSRTNVEEDTEALEKRLTGLSSQLTGLVDEIQGHIRAALTALEDLKAAQTELRHATDFALAEQPA